jgi:hypothetical protein
VQQSVHRACTPRRRGCDHVCSLVCCHRHCSAVRAERIPHNQARVKQWPVSHAVLGSGAADAAAGRTISLGPPIPPAGRRGWQHHHPHLGLPTPRRAQAALGSRLVRAEGPRRGCRLLCLRRVVHVVVVSNLSGCGCRAGEC